MGEGEEGEGEQSGWTFSQEPAAAQAVMREL